MRLPLIIASIVCSLACSSASQAAPAEKRVNSRKLGLNIQVRGGGWGKVERENIENVLYSVADELMSQLSTPPPVPIVVTHTTGNPVALYERGANGEYQVRLHASDSNWHLYVYEFAHELCHVLSNHDRNRAADGRKYNQWFEETLCETASLYTLHRLATTWVSDPPSPEFAAQAERLQAFFKLLINEGHRRLPGNTPLAAWLADNEELLRQDPYLRQKNEVIANLLLPLFEHDPENWAALAYLNLDPGDARGSLRDYLHHWYSQAPAEHRAFIADILGLFWLRDVAPAAPAAPNLLAASGTPVPAAGQGETATHLAPPGG